MSLLLALGFVALGCNNGPTVTEFKPATSAAPAAVPFPVAIPKPAAEIGKVVNPKNEEPYKGPKAKLTGTVRIKGDEPPATNLAFPTGKCAEAAATYGKLFRVGLEGALADAMVTVTGYTGFVPAREEAAKNTIHGCAFSRRTMVATFGQRLEVSNLDKIESYMPYLDGAPSKAILVAVPGGAPVKLFTLQPGHYMLRDQLPNPFLTADVFVLAYATHDVTGLDGKYQIEGVPVGEVVVTAFLPAIDKFVEQKVTLKEGDNTVDLTLEYKNAPAEEKKPEEKKPEEKKPEETKGEKK